MLAQKANRALRIHLKSLSLKLGLRHCRNPTWCQQAVWMSLDLEAWVNNLSGVSRFWCYFLSHKHGCHSQCELQTFGLPSPKRQYVICHSWHFGAFISTMSSVTPQVSSLPLNMCSGNFCSRHRPVSFHMLDNRAFSLGQSSLGLSEIMWSNMDLGNRNGNQMSQMTQQWHVRWTATVARSTPCLAFSKLH